MWGKVLLMVVITIILNGALCEVIKAKPRCKKCENKGYVSKSVDCPLCGGFGDVSPAWFDKVTNTERWTETTYLLTGNVVESEHRVKKMSFMKCPCCAKSIKRGILKTIEKCDCGVEIGQTKIDEAVKKFKKAFDTKNHKLEAKEIDFESDKFKFFRMSVESKSWAFTDLRKDDAIRLIKQAVSGEYDTKSANYLRNATKDDLKNGTAE